MESLLDIAISNYRNALKQYKYSYGDERELNYVGYLLQQCVELTIKHFLEINGIKYPHSHVIEDLLDLVQQTQTPCLFSEQFYDFSPAITKWESKTRYIKDYLLTQHQIERGFGLIKQFLTSNGVSEESLKLKECKVFDISAF